MVEVGAGGSYATAVSRLADATATTLVLVTRPDPAAVAEADRAGVELRNQGIARQHLIVNGVFRAAAGFDDALATALGRESSAVLTALPTGLAPLPRTVVPLQVHSPVGIDGLRGLVSPTLTPATTPGPADAGLPGAELPEAGSTETFEKLIDEIASKQGGLVMTMGKGGVGKTTVAAAVAVALAARGHQVHLTTTDPAAHLVETLGTDARGGAVDGITVSRIDPVAETVAYTAEVLAESGRGLEADAIAVLEEDLASPCTEEIAVFQAFARTVAQAQDGFVVLDTAPTGHTLLLLDAARSFHRELDRQSGQLPDRVVNLLDRLRDPERTHVLLVATPEATPVHEAAHLQADLRRSGITPTAWILNQSLLAAAPVDPLLRARAALEHQHLQEVAGTHAARMVVLPRTPQAPVGLDRLRALTGAPALR